MEGSLASFWGIPSRGAKGIPVSVNRKNPAGGMLLRLNVSEKMKPPWLSRDESPLVFFPEVSFDELEGTPLAWFLKDGRKIPAIARKGMKVTFNFDPEETIRFLISESYYVHEKPFYMKVPINYTSLPRFLRAFLNTLRIMAKKKDMPPFPSWPAEKSVELIRWLFLRSVEQSIGRKPKTRPFWPDGRKYCVVLTHDVDSRSGMANVRETAALEDSRGLKSCWNIVGDLYRIDHSLLADLISRGHEIGLHGVRHDNRIAFLGRDGIKKRLSSCLDLVRKYSIRGFRSPSLLRSEDMFAVLKEHFDYDSSVPDTEKFSQISMLNGCCTVFPYSINGLVELPITIPQDACLLKEMGPEKVLEVWRSKIKFVKQAGGLVNICTHPDSFFSGTAEMKHVYSRLLDELSSDKDAWLALPRDAASHWRKSRM